MINVKIFKTRLSNSNGFFYALCIAQAKQIKNE